MNSELISAQTRSWVESFVVGLNVCPFAGRELSRNRIRFSVSQANDEVALLTALQQELNFLLQDNSIETTLLIHPLVLSDFFVFNDFLELADQLIVQMNLEGVFQVASFHPHYQFAGASEHDAENYTNRAPYPMLHLLRESSVTQAIASHPHVEQIPEDNIAKMMEIGAIELEQRLFDLINATHKIKELSK